MIVLSPGDAQGRPTLTLRTGVPIPTEAEIAFDATLVGQNWHEAEAGDQADFRWMGATGTASVRIIVDRRVDLAVDVTVAHIIDPARWGEIGFTIDGRPVAADLHTDGSRRFTMRAHAVGEMRPGGGPEVPSGPGDEVDAAWYLARNADVAAAGKDAVEHYTLYGRAEGRLPNAAAEARHAMIAQVDPVWYLARYADVAAAGKDPVEHYTLYGHAEGRFPDAASESRHGLARSVLDIGITAPFAVQPSPADPRRLSIAVSRISVRPVAAAIAEREHAVLTAPALPYLRRLDVFASAPGAHA